MEELMTLKVIADKKSLSQMTKDLDRQGYKYFTSSIEDSLADCETVEEFVNLACIDPSIGLPITREFTYKSSTNKVSFTYYPDAGFGLLVNGRSFISSNPIQSWYKFVVEVLRPLKFSLNDISKQAVKNLTAGEFID